MVLDILTTVSTYIILYSVWSDSFLSHALLKISSAGQNAASSYLSIRFPPLAALVCYIRPMSSLRLTFLYEQHWIRRARFHSCQSFLTYYIIGAVGSVKQILFDPTWDLILNGLTRHPCLGIQKMMSILHFKLFRSFFMGKNALVPSNSKA